MVAASSTATARERRRIGVWGSESRGGWVLSRRWTATRCRREQVATDNGQWAMGNGQGNGRIVGKDYVDIPTHACLTPYPPTSERRRRSILTRAPVPLGQCLVRGTRTVGQGSRQRRHWGYYTWCFAVVASWAEASPVSGITRHSANMVCKPTSKRLAPSNPPLVLLVSGVWRLAVLPRLHQERCI
jgi:hypothetical protein